MEKIKKTPRVEARLLLPMLYETKYGIFNHLDRRVNKMRPLASVAFHPAYDTYPDSLMNDLVYRYEENGIQEVYHIDFLEYINLPRSVTLKLDEQSRWVRKQRLKVIEAARAAQEGTAGKGKA